MIEFNPEIMAKAIADRMNKNYAKEVWSFGPPDDEAQDRWVQEQDYRKGLVVGSDNPLEDIAGAAMYDALAETYGLNRLKPTIFQLMDKSVDDGDYRSPDYLYVFPPANEFIRGCAVMLGETYITIYVGYEEVRKTFEWGEYGLSYEVYC